MDLEFCGKVALSTDGPDDMETRATYTKCPGEKGILYLVYFCLGTCSCFSKMPGFLDLASRRDAVSSRLRASSR